jgi:hypothetical protein
LPQLIGKGRAMEMIMTGYGNSWRGIQNRISKPRGTAGRTFGIL